MPSSINKKRKRTGADAVAEEKAARRNSKISDPAPAEESDEEEEVDVEEAEAVESGTGSDADAVEKTDGDNTVSGDEAAEDDQDGDNPTLPAASAPILPPATNSESFDELNLSERSMKAITEMGFTKMTAIQRSVCLPSADDKFSTTADIVV